MDMNYLASQLQQAGWKNVEPNSHIGYEFDLVGGRRFMILTKWNVLVKALPVLDAAATRTWQSHFKTMSDRSKSWLWGKCFLLCLVAQQVSPDTLAEMQGDQFGLFGVLRLQGGGGTILIADEASVQVYGRLPTLPMDARTFSRRTKAILEDALAHK